MTQLTYREACLRTWNTHTGSIDDQHCNVALGLIGEAGEVAELIKKKYFHRKPHDGQKMLLELGDVTYYTEIACHLFGIETIEQDRVSMSSLTAHPAQSTIKLGVYAAEVADKVSNCKDYGIPGKWGSASILLGAVVEIGRVYGFTLNEIRQANTDKLIERWPEGFKVSQ